MVDVTAARKVTYFAASVHKQEDDMYAVGNVQRVPERSFLLDHSGHAHQSCIHCASDKFSFYKVVTSFTKLQYLFIYLFVCLASFKSLSVRIWNNVFDSVQKTRGNVYSLCKLVFS